MSGRDGRNWIYFIQANPSGCVKVGITVDVPQRFRYLKSSNHEELTLIAALPGYEPDEARMHSMLAKWRHRGEWFRPGPWLDVLKHRLELQPATAGQMCLYLGVELS